MESHTLEPRQINWPRLLRRTLVASPFIYPFLFHHFYQPVNANLIVEALGCGCPPINGQRRFNANHFNLIVWLLVAYLCARLWWILSAELNTHSSTRLNLRGAGTGVLVFLCMTRLMQEIWL